MIHLRAGRKLKRTSSHKKALMRNMASALFEHKKIITTVAKAKELRPYAESLITKAKHALIREKQRLLPEGQTIDIHNRRIVYRDIQNKAVLQELFDTIAPMVENRPGGYTRIIKTGYRRGDSGESAIIELVDWSAPQDGTVSMKQRSQRRQRGRQAKGAAPVVKHEEGEEIEAMEEIEETSEVIEEIEISETNDTFEETMISEPINEEIVSEIPVSEPIVEETPVEVPLTEPIVEEVSIPEPIVEETPVEVPLTETIVKEISVPEPIVEETPVEVPTDEVEPENPVSESALEEAPNDEENIPDEGNPEEKKKNSI